MQLDNYIQNNLGDSPINSMLQNELKRQNEGIELIASENYPSSKVRLAMASIASAKYAEGYPNKRYYGGCEFIDQIEQYAIDKACELFKCKYANVQPHSGSQANAEAYRALEVYLTKQGKITDRKMKILTMDLNSGSHLSHGSPVSFSSHYYDFDFFQLGKDGKLDFTIIEEKIKEFKPDVLLTGYSAYPYVIDFTKFKELADQYGCLLMVDMAHIAGIVAAGLCQNPCDFADIVTTTTHKTLRGPRGGLILTNNEDIYKKVNSAVFAFTQGGPLEQVIAAKAICFEEALTDDFKNYMKSVIKNTDSAAYTLRDLGAEVSLTENHLFLLNTLASYGLTGFEAQKRLEKYHITTNKNMMPNDKQKPTVTSGLRIGFAAVTTRGCTILDSIIIAHIIHAILSQKSEEPINPIILERISKTIEGWKKIEEI